MSIRPHGAAPTLDARLREAALALQPITEEGRFEAELLLAEALRCSRAQLLARLRDPLDAEAAERFDALVERRTRAEPVAYILGRAAFHTIELKVTPDVLIPRPETELLVDWCLDWLGRRQGAAKFLDIGTGSGAIALAVAKVSAAEHRFWATDISSEALAIARENAIRLGLQDRVTLLQADLIPAPSSAIPDRFDLVAANLPYVGSEEQDALMADVVDFEPHLALFSGAGGLDLIGRLLPELPARLTPGAAVLLEIGAGQGPAVMALAAAAFPRARSALLADLAGLDRILIIETEPRA
jgi:release factor glutamine methyltransferase